MATGILLCEFNGIFSGAMHPRDKLQLPLLTIEASLEITKLALPSLPWEHFFYDRQANKDTDGLPRAIAALLTEVQSPHPAEPLP